MIISENIVIFLTIYNNISDQQKHSHVKTWMNLKIEIPGSF